MSQQKVSPQQSILAGFTAGGAESLITVCNMAFYWKMTIYTSGAFLKYLTQSSIPPNISKLVSNFKRQLINQRHGF